MIHCSPTAHPHFSLSGLVRSTVGFPMTSKIYKIVFIYLEEVSFKITDTFKLLAKDNVHSSWPVAYWLPEVCSLTTFWEKKKNIMH